jgi:hypothetical protein
MKHALFAMTAITAVVITGAAVAQPPRSVPDIAMSGASAAALQALFKEWDRAGFLPPSKPAQYRVYGRDGYVTSGPQYNYMVSLIRAAVADSRAGRDRAKAYPVGSGHPHMWCEACKRVLARPLDMVGT